MRSNRKGNRIESRLWAAIGAVAVSTMATAPVIAGQNGAGTPDQEVTISISGSTAIKNFITSQGFTDLLPGSSIVLNIGGTMAAGPTTLTASQFGNGLQLAPTTFTPGLGLDSSGSTADALRVEYHESGSVEGIYELANDQVGPIPYVEEFINRNPNGGNAVWVNGNQIGGVSAPNGNSLTPPHNDPGGNYLGPYYGDPTGTVAAFGPGVVATFTNYGVNTTTGLDVVPGVNTSPVDGTIYTQAGQNSVQVAVSDVVPIQAFQNTAIGTAASQPWFSTPQNLNYGVGNTNVHTGGLGIVGGGVSLQAIQVLNMGASAINPATGGTFGVGPWNTGGLANLNSGATAVTGTLFVANPGTDLDRLNQIDAQWLQTTGRLANGAAFDMTTRDVNSGTHNVIANDVGIDPAWVVGVNDGGNGNAVNGATTQINVGSSTVTGGLMPINIGGMRFTNKTSGGAQLRPTVQDARMAVGTLGISDANGVFIPSAYNLRALDYAQGAVGSSASYVQVSAYNIVTGNYAIIQNEQFVTLKSPQAGDPTFSTMTTDQWAQVSTGGTVTVAPTNGTGGMVPIQGDDSTGAVSQVLANVSASLSNLALGTFNSPAYSYLSKGFILPQDMTVENQEDGVDNLSAAYVVNPDPTQTTQFLNSTFTTSTTSADPDTIFGRSGDIYGGKGSNAGQFAEGAIPETTFNNGANPTVNSGNNGGNWMFGNFNQNGIRDFDSVVVQATEALAVLENAETQNSGGTLASASVNAGLPNSAVIGTLAPVTINGITYTMPTALTTMTNTNFGNTLGLGTTGATKGDLIMMGDMTGRGDFDGFSLYQLATGASIADATSTFVTTSQNAGGNDRLTLQSENISILTPNVRDGSTPGSGGQSNTYTQVTQETYGDAVRRGTLFKNAALDYLNNFATPQMKIEAASILSVPGTIAPSGSTDLGNVPDSGGNPVEYFTYDPNGANAYNKSDVNRDGTIDMNDAILVDNNNGKDYANMTDELNATQQTPVTGATTTINLVLVKQVDPSAANGYSTTIGATDLGVINTSLAASKSANWYGYNLQKTGPGAIVWGQTAGNVRVYSGASFQISGGSVQVGAGTIDPFTDNTLASPTTGNHVALALDHGGHFKINGPQRNVAVGGLSIDTSTPSLVDVGNGGMVINYASPANDPVASVVTYLKTGSNGGLWTGTAGIVSSTAASISGPQTAVGYNDGNTDSGTAGPNQIVVKYTLAGDANLDGFVNFGDLVAVVQNFNKAGTDWAHGNFSYGASTNFGDLVTVVQNFNKVLTFSSSTGGSLTTAPLINNTAVQLPEPAAFSLLGAGAAGLLARRRRRKA